jgi:uridine kinase
MVDPSLRPLGLERCQPVLPTRRRVADALSTYGVHVGSEQPQRPEGNAAACVVLRARAASAPALMQCRVVAIDGPGGAGKSTLAARVADGLDAQIICTDDFANWEEPLEWWPRLIEQVLDPLGRNQPGRYQRFDWDTRQLAEWREVPVAAFLVLEGVSASRAAFAPYLSLRVWVSTPRRERLRRGLERDGLGALSLWQEWMAQEDDYIAAEHPDEHADLSVSGITPVT